ncbi:methyl-accepting chemotaxis protein [Bdellovibrio sp. HCB2-146]|uniref:HAMP domain-containing methyl-accepting chemotaxis protein n=1 Tax=Bdellovibrio sp. HCB2-146 TaxID=3394362 RepID=UPI0039BD0347
MNSPSSWFRGIKGKLLFAAAMPIVGFAIVYTISHSNLGSLAALLKSANTDVIPSIQGLGEMRQARNKFGYYVWAAIASQEHPDKKAERVKIAKDAADEMKKAMEFYESFPFTPEAEAAYAPALKVKDEYLGTLYKVVSLIEEGKPESYKEAQNIMEGRIVELAAVMHKMTGDSMKYYNDRAANESKMAVESVNNANFMTLAVTLISCISIFSVLLWIASRIASSVGSIASRLSEAGGQVAASVEQLNEAGNSLSQSSTEAAASLEETVAALEEMTSMVQMNSDNAKQAAALSASSKEAAETGEREIHSLIESMNQISQSSKKIEEIISVIDDIAFQTNLLALNAAVEAARAGEQGKGFAVVAEAVRALAQRSASAAKDITSLIKDSVAQIDTGSQIADQSGTVLANIVNSVKKVSDLNNEIAAASSEQTTGIQQISKAMNQLDQASQSNAASAEEIAATSGEINNLAATNQSLTVELNNVVLGTTTSDTPPVPTVAAKAHKKAKPAGKPGNVIAMRRPVEMEKTKTSIETILFDDDERAKVGNTQGF